MIFSCQKTQRQAKKRPNQGYIFNRVKIQGLVGMGEKTFYDKVGREG